jgi:hypothetical protein
VEALLQQTVVSGPTPSDVLYWVLELPEGPGAHGELLVGARPGEPLPTRGTIQDPPDALARPGWYLTVSGKAPGTVDVVYYIAPLSDPRIIVAERATGTALDATVIRLPEGGVLSGRAPFVPNGALHVFEVGGGGGHVTRVLLALRFGDDSYPESGRRFLVPYSP